MYTEFGFDPGLPKHSTNRSLRLVVVLAEQPTADRSKSSAIEIAIEKRWRPVLESEIVSATVTETDFVAGWRQKGPIPRHPVLAIAVSLFSV